MTAQMLTISSSTFSLSYEKFRQALVWLIFASSFMVIFEPAPTDLFFFMAFAAYLYSGLNYTAAIMPLMLLLLFYNMGGFLSYVMVSPIQEALMFEVTSLYMAASAIFLASFLSIDTERRVNLLFSGYIFGAVVAGILALLGFLFFKSIGKTFIALGANDLIRFGRATGLFKDPNVFSTYMVFPCVLLAQRLLLGIGRRPLLNLVFFGIVFISLVLAMSRGAWINVSASILTMAILTFVLTESNNMRGRIAFYSFAGALIIGITLVLLLSSPEMQHMFLDRFTLVKSYDAGERGRFGNQLNAIPLLLERPFGFGPVQFTKIFHEAPHNTFLNSFSSCGWLGGISYFALVGCNLYVGLRTAFTKGPFQNHAILVFSCLVEVIFQGIQIDTEHWRHYYWMMGLMWGLFAATLNYQTSVRTPSVMKPSLRFTLGTANAQ
jgi:hypothetical protein